MKNSIDTMKEIIDSTYRQIEENLPSGEYLISRLTVYDKNNGVSTNIFLTNQAIFLQESNELEKIKKRRFEKINDIKLTTNEIYIEFINGYKIIGDISKTLSEAERFFGCIKSNTKIRTSSTKDLQDTPIIEDTKPITRRNQFLDSKREVSKPSEVIDTLEPNYYPDDDLNKKKGKKKNKIILIVVIIITVLILAVGGTIGGIAIYNNNKAKSEEKAKIALVQSRADELLQYQLANNAFYDYIFELQAEYDEITLNLASMNLAEIETIFGNLQKDFEKKYVDAFKSSSSVKAIYDISKIDEWMNNNKTLVEETFETFEECLDGNFRNEVKMLELKKQLSDADGEIRKVQTILSEEKEAVKKALSELTGETYSQPTSNSNASTDDKTESEKVEDKKEDETTEEKEVEEFIDENDKHKAPTIENNGRDDDAAYSGE